MLQLAPIILVAVILARDEGLVLPWLRGAGWGWSWTCAGAAIPIVLILLAAHGVVQRCNRRVTALRSVEPLRPAEKLVQWARVLIILHFAVSVLLLDWLGAVRSLTGNLVLVDEIIALLPALLGLAGTWWVYYPIERRVQDALMLRRLDEGENVYPTLDRGAFVLMHVRLHLLMMLVPILMIVGLREMIEMVASRSASAWAAEAANISTLLAGVLVFMIAPPVICALLDAKPMPAGELRCDLLALAKRHHVRLRNVLVWNTAGTMINAAVLGIVGWLRYVLITDALLDAMSRRQILAVMAHEVGHVRRRHMLWLAGVLLAAIFVTTHAVSVPLYLMSDAQLERVVSFGVGAELVIVASSMTLTLLLFGWVCRRFERQADTFAVQHLSAAGGRSDEEPLSHAAGDSEAAGDVPPSTRVTIESVEAMQSALQAIARLNAIDPKRPSWRHGSIAWRQAYLASLPGQLLDRLAIDRIVLRIKAMTAATLIVAAAAYGVSLWAQRDAVRPSGHVVAKTAWCVPVAKVASPGEMR